VTHSPDTLFSRHSTEKTEIIKKYLKKTNKNFIFDDVIVDGDGGASGGWVRKSIR
jgi:hypothetical protein